MKLYYLTSLPFAISNLVLSRIKISRISELNDPFELKSANLNDPCNRRVLETFKYQTNKSHGLICFSSSWNNPVLWSHYADSHRGVAIGFEVSEKLLFKVSYKNERFDLPMDSVTNQITVDEKTLHTLLSRKFSDWKYEKEWRYFIPLRDYKIESGLYFEKFSADLNLIEIILGTKCELSITEMQSLTKKLGIPIQVQKARLDSKTYKII
jgi:hypothetical protein